MPGSRSAGGLAALAVVCSHMPPLAAREWNHAYGLGAMGVEFFFLLSGFIMLHIHYRDLGRPSAVARFAWRRAGRIFPTYWIIFALALGVDALLVSAQYRARVDPTFLVTQVVLWPGTSLFLGPAWTLRHELLFYSVFAVAIANWRAGVALFALWMAGVLIALPTIGPGMAPTRYVQELLWHHYNLDFGIGMAMAFFLRRGLMGRAIVIALVSTVVLVAAWAKTGFAPSTWLHVATYKAAFALVLAVLIHASIRAPRAPAMLLLLGAASYSIYLINRGVGYDLMRVVRRVPIDRWIGEWPLFILFVGIAVTAGVVIHLLIERPVLRWVASHSPGRRIVPSQEPMGR